MPTVSMRQLLEAGVHFGHQTRRWNPKMRPFIFAERNGIHIIDLAQTVQRLDLALDAVRETTARGESILFVGTKKQAQEPISQEADRAGQPYVNQRWLGGMLTNFVTIKKRLGLLEQLEARLANGDFERMPKKEAAPLHGGAAQAPPDARRHPQDEARARGGVHRRPGPRADRGRRRPASSRSRSSAPATRTSIPTRSTSSSRPTTTRSAPSACSASSSPTRRSRAAASERRAPSASPSPSRSS